MTSAEFRDLAESIDDEPASMSLHSAADEIDRLNSRVAELELDAKRYQWLREIGRTEEGLARLEAAHPGDVTPTPEQFDAAIDAAMEAK